jgi:hypothetical protein
MIAKRFKKRKKKRKREKHRQSDIGKKRKKTIEV